MLAVKDMKTEELSSKKYWMLLSLILKIAIFLSTGLKDLICKGNEGVSLPSDRSSMNGKTLRRFQ